MYEQDSLPKYDKGSKEKDTAEGERYSPLNPVK
jgi:hypothetical protein